MAIVRAVKTGNWSDTTVWNTGALPTSSDDVYSNTFTVTIDISPTVLSISNAATTGVTAGGSFVPTNGFAITATNGVFGGTAPIHCINSSLTVGQSFSIVGSIYGTLWGTSASSATIIHSGAGTISITGNCTAGTSGNNQNCIVISGSGAVALTGNVIGGGAGTVNTFGILLSGSGSLSIIGTVSGGASTTGAGCIISSSGIIDVIGPCVPGACPAILTSVSGINYSATVILTGPFLTNSSGVNPILCPKWFWKNTSPPSTYYQIRSANLAVIRPLYTADSVGGNPAVANVRSGTIYGPSSELAGTLAVPPTGSVALGVPVDNTTGTAIITEATIANALATASAVTLNQQTSSLNTSGSIGERLKLASTVATTAQQLSDALSNE